MIYTRFGSRVEIVGSAFVENGIEWVPIILVVDAHLKDVRRCDLRADAGAYEIEQALAAF